MDQKKQTKNFISYIRNIFGQQIEDIFYRKQEPKQNKNTKLNLIKNQLELKKDISMFPQFDEDSINLSRSNHQESLHSININISEKNSNDNSVILLENMTAKVKLDNKHDEEDSWMTHDIYEFNNDYESSSFKNKYDSDVENDTNKKTLVKKIDDASEGLEEKSNNFDDNNNIFYKLRNEEMRNKLKEQNEYFVQLLNYNDNLNNTNKEIRISNLNPDLTNIKNTGRIKKNKTDKNLINQKLFKDPKIYKKKIKNITNSYKTIKNNNNINSKNDLINNKNIAIHTIIKKNITISTLTKTISTKSKNKPKNLNNKTLKCVNKIKTIKKFKNIEGNLGKKNISYKKLNYNDIHTNSYMPNKEKNNTSLKNYIKTAINSKNILKNIPRIQLKKINTKETKSGKSRNVDDNFSNKIELKTTCSLLLSKGNKNQCVTDRINHQKNIFSIKKNDQKNTPFVKKKKTLNEMKIFNNNKKFTSKKYIKEQKNKASRKNEKINK